MTRSLPKPLRSQPPLLIPPLWQQPLTLLRNTNLLIKRLVTHKHPTNIPIHNQMHILLHNDNNLIMQVLGQQALANDDSYRPCK